MQLVDLLMKFENGEMNDQEIVDCFQELIDSGLAWELQGLYGRTAKALIDGGYIIPENKKRCHNCRCFYQEYENNFAECRANISEEALARHFTKDIPGCPGWQVKYPTHEESDLDA